MAREWPVTVSVLMITFNHAKFIAEAIESVLAQDCGFDYELVIGEDCSTDGTREIVRDFAAQHPERIRALLRDRNLGMNANFAATLTACRGEYVAMLDGDDYWTSRQKLSRQVAFLDQHREYAICFHNVQVLAADGRSWPYNAPGARQTFTLEDLLRGNFIVTCSVMFRNRLFDALPDWFFGLRMGDWPVHVFNACHGKIRYLDEVMAVYRMHSGGALSMRGAIDALPAVITACERLNEHFEFRFEPLLRERIVRSWYALAIAHRESGQTGAALGYAWKCLTARPVHRYWDYRIKVVLRLVAPRLVEALRHARQRDAA